MAEHPIVPDGMSNDTSFAIQNLFNLAMIKLLGLAQTRSEPERYAMNVQ